MAARQPRRGAAAPLDQGTVAWQAGAGRQPFRPHGAGRARPHTSPMCGWRPAPGRSARQPPPRLPSPARRLGRHRAAARPWAEESRTARPAGSRTARVRAAKTAARGKRRRAPVRIVGGEFRGRPLATPRSHRIRPTPTARARRCSTSLRIASANGSPARACSTCSPAPARSGWRRCRAAPPSPFSSRNRPKAAALIRDNVEALGLTGRTKIFRRDATRLGEVGTMAAVRPCLCRPALRQGPRRAGAGVGARTGGWLGRAARCVVVEESDGGGLRPGRRLRAADDREAMATL